MSRSEGSKTIRATILNITQLGDETCDTITFAIKNKNDKIKKYHNIPTPRKNVEKLFKLTNIEIPDRNHTRRKNKKIKSAQQKFTKKSP
ncbi:MAG: hypothetical protein LBP59_04085 [Planctomycetaceae bacterium]|jgi:hypothetical protein|nr:hypothetical protein [Planctomycetaceae bacterium]